MKKFLILLVFGGILSQGAYSQNVAINTTGSAANSSSILDLNTGNNYTGSNGKGVLLPNVALTGATDAVTITNPATSLLVYVPSGSGLTPAGYYYNSGTPASPVWSIFKSAATEAASSVTGSSVTSDNAISSKNTGLAGTFKTSNTSFTSTGTTITLPATAGTYLIIASAEVACIGGSANATYTTSVYLTDGTNYYGNTSPATSTKNTTSDWAPWTTTFTTTTPSATYAVYICNPNPSAGSFSCARNISISYIKIN